MARHTLHQIRFTSIIIILTNINCIAFIPHGKCRPHKEVFIIQISIYINMIKITII
jgi:hypothetical protein